MYQLSGICSPNRHEVHEVLGSELYTNFVVFEGRIRCEVHEIRGPCSGD